MTRELRWEGACNHRDLGGLRRHDGTLTATGRLFRSGRTESVTESGWRSARAPAALGAVSMFAELEDENRLAAIDSRFPALGHPEKVETNLEAVLTEGVANPSSAQAVWQRGEIDPDLAWPIASELPARYGSRQLLNVQIPSSAW